MNVSTPYLLVNISNDSLVMSMCLLIGLNENVPVILYRENSLTLNIIYVI